MNKDFRVLVTLPTHPKTKKLMRQLGDRSFYNLIRLWAWVAQNKPEGVLANMDKEDIEIAADWEGDEGLFLDTLIDLRLVDCDDGVCNIHDWEDNNGFAFGARERSEKARKAARAKWDKYNAKHAKICSEHSSEQDQALLNDAQSYAPSPSPSIKNIIPAKEKKLEFKFKTKVPLPANFKLTDDMKAYAAKRLFKGNLEKWHSDMMLSATAKNYKYADWHAAWKKWLSMHIDRHPECVETEKVYL